MSRRLLVHASPFDFVSALTAEEACPLCSELHAIVDQCVCDECGTNMCPDCASLRPDTRWNCAACASSSAVLAFPAASKPTLQRIRALRISLHETATERTQRARQQLAPVVQRSSVWLGQRRQSSLGLLDSFGARVGTLVQGTNARLLAALATVVTLMLAVRARSTPAVRRLLSQSASLAQRSLRGSATRLSHGAARLGTQSLTLVGTVRNWPWRQHAASLFLATVLLIAVARSHNETR